MTVTGLRAAFGCFVWSLEAWYRIVRAPVRGAGRRCHCGRGEGQQRPPTSSFVQGVRAPEGNGRARNGKTTDETLRALKAGRNECNEGSRDADDHRALLGRLGVSSGRRRVPRPARPPGYVLPGLEGDGERPGSKDLPDRRRVSRCDVPKGTPGSNSATSRGRSRSESLSRWRGSWSSSASGVVGVAQAGRRARGNAGQYVVYRRPPIRRLAA